MFASIISGALISLVLFYLAPLPLMVAAIGWGPLGAPSAASPPRIGLGALFGLPYCIAFAITVALPAWWLGHLAMLGRPVVSRDRQRRRPVAPAMEWYPTGRLLLWIAVFAVADHDRRPAHARHRRRRRSRRPCERGLLRIIDARASVAADDIERRDRCAGRDRARRCRHRRHDDADAQSVARRQGHRDVGPAEAALARPEDARRCRR